MRSKVGNREHVQSNKDSGGQWAVQKSKGNMQKRYVELMCTFGLNEPDGTAEK